MAIDKDDQDTTEVEEPTEPEPKEKAPAPKVKSDEEGGVTVELAERKTRRERRSESREAVIQRLQEDLAATRRQMNDMSGYLSRRAVAEPAASTGDPDADEIENIRREQESLQSSLRTGAVADEAGIERIRKRYYALNDRERAIERARLKREVADEVRREAGPRGTDYAEATLQSEYPDVIANGNAMTYARGEYFRLVAKGAPPTLATSKQAMANAAEEFGLRRATMPASTTAQQARYGLPSSQPGPNGSNGGGVRLNAQQMKMAVARWPGDDEHVAYERMAKLLSSSTQGD